MKYNSVCDSGDKTFFDTGGVRDLRTGKGRYDLFPFYGLHRVAQHFENGAGKYGERNWEKGLPLHTYIDSAIRHLVKYMMDKNFKRKSKEDHLAAAAWNILCLIESEELIKDGLLSKELNDLPGRDDDE